MINLSEELEARLEEAAKENAGPMSLNISYAHREVKIDTFKSGALASVARDIWVGEVVKVLRIREDQMKNEPGFNLQFPSEFVEQHFKLGDGTGKVGE